MSIKKTSPQAWPDIDEVYGTRPRSDLGFELCGLQVGDCFELTESSRDVSAMVKGLPDDRCQAPHWGYLFSGRVIVDYGDRTETIEAGSAYSIEPGHRITFPEDSDALEFTPTAELERTFEAVRRNAAAVGESGQNESG